jgi:hypothetical protein
MARGRKTRVRNKPARPGLGPGTLLSPIIGASLIVTIAYAASLLQASAEVVAAAALAFAAAEGLILAIIGALWAQRRSVGIAVAMAVLTALLAVPGRWLLAYLHANRTPPLLDLMEDLGITILWAAFAGLAGATILRQRLSNLLPER